MSPEQGRFFFRVDMTELYEFWRIEMATEFEDSWIDYEAEIKARILDEQIVPVLEVILR